MSKVGKSHINVPSSVKVTINGAEMLFEGGKNKVKYLVPEGIKVDFENSILVFSLVNEKNKDKFLDAIWGTTRANVNNIIKGLVKPFEKRMEFVGVGYRASVSGRKIEMKLGFSHDVIIDIPDGVDVVAEKPTLLLFKSHDCQLLGNFARKIQVYRKPEPYKGKGLIIDKQYVYRKEGKKK